MILTDIILLSLTMQGHLQTAGFLFLWTLEIFVKESNSFYQNFN